MADQCGSAEEAGPGAGKDEAPFRSAALATHHLGSPFTPGFAAKSRAGVDDGRLWFCLPDGRRDPGALAERQTAGEPRPDNRPQPDS